MEKQKNIINEKSEEEIIQLEKLDINELKLKLEEADREYKEAQYHEKFTEMQKYAGEYNIIKGIIDEREKGSVKIGGDYKENPETQLE